jgi:CRISPR/Cas system endoribonuclease Cas6 (RAMP superfamily)
VHILKNSKEKNNIQKFISISLKHTKFTATLRASIEKRRRGTTEKKCEEKRPNSKAANKHTVSERIEREKEKTEEYQRKASIVRSRESDRRGESPSYDVRQFRLFSRLVQ